ncbi:hypothetical protein ACGC1H_006418 [Rhizoctonia solani]
MSNQTICRELILDIHPKFKLDDSALRVKAAQDLYAAFAQFPTIRFVYHRPKTSMRKAEHIYVLFDSTSERQRFYKRRRDPLRLTFNYHGGVNIIPDLVLQEMQEKMLDMGVGAIYGPLFRRAEPQVQSEDTTQAKEASDRNESPVGQVQSKRPRKETEDEVKGFLNDLKRVKFEVTKK